MTADTCAGAFHSPRHARGCTVRPGGHVGRLPAVRVWRSTRARRHGGSPRRRRSRRGPTRDWARWGRGPAVWSRTGGWRSGGGENAIFFFFLFFCSHFCHNLFCRNQDNPVHLSRSPVLSPISHTCVLQYLSPSFAGAPCQSVCVSALVKYLEFCLA